MMPDSYYGMIEQERSRASVASQRYWDEQARKRREERKKAKEVQDGKIHC